MAIAQLQQACEEPEPIIEEYSGENSYDLQPTPPVEVVEQDSSELDESEVSPHSCCVIPPCDINKSCILSYVINLLTEPLMLILLWLLRRGGTCRSRWRKTPLQPQSRQHRPHRSKRAMTSLMTAVISFHSTSSRAALHTRTSPRDWGSLSCPMMMRAMHWWEDGEERKKGFSSFSKAHSQFFFLSFSRHVLLYGGLYCVTWGTCQNPNLRTHRPKRPTPSCMMCLAGKAGGWAAWWDWTR